ncbi:ATP-binding protein [Halomonas sp.]|uniref:ATP-binding protein n=1 Tax=Halomonas sp. TaxID=1486246 RepID=UPI00384ECFED
MRPTTGGFLPAMAASLAWLVAVSAAAILWGLLTSHTWQQVGAAEAQVHVTSALGFVFTGLGLALSRRFPRGWLTWSLAAVVVSLGLLTVGQYVFRSGLGVEALFFALPQAGDAPFPGRMAPATALGFILAGSAIPARRPLRVGLACALVLLMGLVAVDKWAGGATSLPPVALPTQALFMLLVPALLWLSPARHLDRLPVSEAILAACLLTLLMALWQLLERQQWLERQRETATALDTIANLFEEQMGERGDALWRLADRWSIYGGMSRDQWRREAQRYIEDFHRINVMVLANPDLTVRWQVSRDEHLPSLEGASLGTNQGREATFAAALAQRRPQLMPFLDLRVGERGTAFTVPVFSDEDHVGYINASIAADEILAAVAAVFSGRFHVALLDEGVLEAGTLPEAGDIGGAMIQEVPIELYGRNWRMAVWPTNSHLVRQSTQLPLFVVLFGLFAGGLSLATLKLNRLQLEKRRRADEAARVSDERFHYVARATSDVIWDRNLLDDTLWWNEGLVDVFGYTREEDADTDWWRARIHPDDREAVLASIQGLIDGDAIDWRSDYRFMDAAGSYRYVTDKGFVIRDDDGTAIRMVGGIIDNTEQRETAERLLQAQKMDAVGRLTGGVAHDFNNLLTVILGNGEMLEEALEANPDLRELAEMIVAAAGRGAELTGRLLAFARRQPLEPCAVDVNELLARMEGLLRRTLEAHIDIRMVLADGGCRTEVDPGQLESALLNLVINARDAMATGGSLTIETARTALDDSYAEGSQEGRAGDYVMLSVSDTGVGMPEEVSHRAFEPFFTTKAQGKGTGLGLSMVHGFIKQSGGHVRIYSEPGEGTTIKLYLPLLHESETPPAPTEKGAAPAGGCGKHILMVEDDSLVRRHVEAMLVSLGYRVSSASSGGEALDILTRQDDIALLFTDVIMPGEMNGPALAQRALQFKPGLKVLYTSGYTENAIVHHGRLDPGVRLLSKPYSRQELAERIGKALAESR